MLFNKNIFISHSSVNKEIAEHLSAYLIRVGVKEPNIFCSSIIGQGVANGEKLNATIGKAIKKSKLIIFLFCSETKKYLIVNLSRSQVFELNSPIGFLVFIHPVLTLP